MLDTCSGGARWFNYDKFSGTIHVSGHAAGRAKTLLQLVKPKYFIRCTGSTGICSGTRRWRINWMRVRGDFAFGDGRQIDLRGGVHRRDPVTAGRVCVDSGSLEEI